jgi:hypothetical protein
MIGIKKRSWKPQASLEIWRPLDKSIGLRGSWLKRIGALEHATMTVKQDIATMTITFLAMEII